MRSVAITTLCLLALLAAVPARAQQFSNTNIQVLAGTGFDDWHFGNKTDGDVLQTFTLEHITGFKYGDVYFFTDLLYGNFEDAAGNRTGSKHRIYAEAALRVSPIRLAGGKPLTGIVRDVYVAAGTDRDGGGLAATLAGGSVDLGLPLFRNLSVSAYYRKDTYNDATVQVTTVWNLPIGKAPLTFTGFLDVHGTDSFGTDWHAQPQLLIEPRNSPLAFGTELYLHFNRHINTVAPQALVRWTL